MQVKFFILFSNLNSEDIIILEDVLILSYDQSYCNGESIIQLSLGKLVVNTNPIAKNLQYSNISLKQRDISLKSWKP